MKALFAPILVLFWASTASSNDPMGGGTLLDDDQVGTRNLFVILPVDSNVTFCDQNTSLTCDAGSSCQIDSTGNEACIIDRLPLPNMLRGSVVIPCDNTSTLVCDKNNTSCQIDLSGNETCATNEAPIFHILFFARGVSLSLGATSSSVTSTPCPNTTTLICDVGSTCQVDEASGNEMCVFLPVETFATISLGAGESCNNTTKCESGFTCQINGTTGEDTCVPVSEAALPQVLIDEQLAVPTLYAYDFSSLVASCSNSSTLVCDPGTVCQDDGSGNETCASPIYYSTLGQVIDPVFAFGTVDTTNTNCANTTSLVCDAGTICMVNATGYESCNYPILYDEAVPLLELTPTPVIAEPTSASTIDSATTVDVTTSVSSGVFVCNLFCIQGFVCAPDSTGKATCVPESSSPGDATTTIASSSGGFVCNLLCIQGFVCVPDSTGKATCVPESSSPDAATTNANSGGFVCNLLCIQGYVCAPDSTGKATCVPENASTASTPDSQPDQQGNHDRSDPEWWPRVMEHFQGTNLKRCYKRRYGTLPVSGQKCSNRKQKTCFFGTKQCPNGVGASPVMRCTCNGAWSCTDAVCALSATDGIE